MEAANTLSEVVWIKDQNRLVDAESYERAYDSDGGRPLPSGYYIANWPKGTMVPHFLHDDVTFIGPFASRREAEMTLAGISICRL